MKSFIIEVLLITVVSLLGRLNV